MRKPITNHATRLLTVLGMLLWMNAVCVQDALADDLQGRNDPALQAAIATWLEDDDEHSLPAIANLAADGNIAARILLARIEEVDRSPREYVNKLSRKARVELFRSTSGKGVFRPSWLKSEAKNGNQTSAALLQASRLQVDIEAIDKLYLLGEVEAAYNLIKQVGANGSREEKKQLQDFLPRTAELAPYIQALQNLDDGLSPGLAALQLIAHGQPEGQPEASLKVADQDTITAASFVEMGYQTGIRSIDFNPQNRYFDMLADWINSSVSTTPVAKLCDRHCAASEIKACAVTAFGLAGGYYKVIQFDSPVESLIDQPSYVSSDRASGMMLRRISSIKDASGTKLLAADDKLDEKSRCLARVFEERAGT